MLTYFLRGFFILLCPQPEQAHRGPLLNILVPHSSQIGYIFISGVTGILIISPLLLPVPLLL